MSTSGPTRSAGCQLQVQLYGVGELRPVITTTLRQLKFGAPPETTTHFSLPEGVRVAYEPSVDVAAAANAFAPYDLPFSSRRVELTQWRGPGRGRRLRAWPHHLDRLAAARPGRSAAAAAASRSRRRQDYRCWDIRACRTRGIVDHAVSRTWRRLSAGRHCDVRDAAARQRSSCWSGSDERRSRPTGTSSGLGR